MKRLFFIISLSCIGSIFAYESLEDKVRTLSGYLHAKIDNCGIYGPYSECKLYDRMGGQPPVSDRMADSAIRWISENMSSPSKFYYEKIPRTDLLIDRQKKSRQDCIMKCLGSIRKQVFYTYCHSLALGQDMSFFDTMAKDYSKLMASKSWRDIGDRQNAVVILHAKRLLKLVETIYSDNLIVFESILKAKKRMYSIHTSSRSSNSAQMALILKRIDEAEGTAVAAQNNARWAAEAAEAALTEAQSLSTMGNNNSRTVKTR